MDHEGDRGVLYAPDVLGDDLLGAVREVEVDEIREQSHGDDEGRVAEKCDWSLCACATAVAGCPSINRGGAVKGRKGPESKRVVGVVWCGLGKCVPLTMALEFNYGSSLRLRGTVDHPRDCRRFRLHACAVTSEFWRALVTRKWVSFWHTWCFLFAMLSFGLLMPFYVFHRPE